MDSARHKRARGSVYLHADLHQEGSHLRVARQRVSSRERHVTRPAAFQRPFRKRNRPVLGLNAPDAGPPPALGCLAVSPACVPTDNAQVSR